MEADSKWLSLVFTSPEQQPNEAEHITALLRSSAADYVHIRKPQWTSERIAMLLRGIPEELHPRLTLHDCFDLLQEFPAICGVHLNSRNLETPEGVKRVSCSCHSLSEVENKSEREYAYITLSPVFDSISKPGYAAAFSLNDLKESLCGKRVVALGGITPCTFPLLKRAGFIGAAMLGYVWDNVKDATAKIKKYKALTADFSLQFITNAATAEETIWQVATAYKSGCRWVQVRMKDAPDYEVEKVLEEAVNLRNDATLLVDDNVTLARKYGIGVHLGKNDMHPKKAREILGEDAIIGSTCNTAEDIAEIIQIGASDYIGLGPFRFTGTKKNLAPVLGIQGYKRLLASEGMSRPPVVAIGGITASDVRDLLRAGADGVAVSGAIMNRTRVITPPSVFLDEINNYTLHI